MTYKVNCPVHGQVWESEYNNPSVVPQAEQYHRAVKDCTLDLTLLGGPESGTEVKPQPSIDDFF